MVAHCPAGQVQAAVLRETSVTFAALIALGAVIVEFR